MNEEEKNAIKFLQKLEFDEYEWWYFGEEYKTREETEKAFEKAQKIILNLIDKQKEEIKELNLENQAFYEEINCNDNEYISKKYFQLKENNKKDYISKEKILKALGYEENNEEYKRIYNKEELILSLIRTINTECDRLEDIEDQKVMLEIHNIENMRDKYWQDKIKQKIKILENINDSLKFVENRGYEPETYIINSNKYIINFLNKLLEGGAK